MPSTTHVLDEARDLVKKRLAELDDERKRLERALAELGGKATEPRRPGRRRGRPKGSGERRKAKGQRSHPAAVAVAAAPAPIRPCNWSRTTPASPLRRSPKR